MQTIWSMQRVLLAHRALIAIEILNKRSCLRRCHVVDFLICLATIAKPFSHEWRNYARDTHLGTFFVYFVKFVLEIFSKEVSHRRATAGVLTKSLDAPLLIK